MRLKDPVTELRNADYNSTGRFGHVDRAHSTLFLGVQP